ncbi:MAG TPA: hypothetical protein VK111_00490 [Virgibacillus sp.]|nr:hypothetical protein [Virgibacillus sp.]
MRLERKTPPHIEFGILVNPDEIWGGVFYVYQAGFSKVLQSINLPEPACHLRTGWKFNQGKVLIEKPPPNRVRIQSRMGLD